ncbi:hypothetical protein EDB84DRAFT_1447148 [Lactarius hengduanensis]|nr:hypothetical protein EDB84DRAFT_1447148 [Lactarius hengduanensis]
MNARNGRPANASSSGDIPSSVPCTRTVPVWARRRKRNEEGRSRVVRLHKGHDTRRSEVRYAPGELRASTSRIAERASTFVRAPPTSSVQYPYFEMRENETHVAHRGHLRRQRGPRKGATEGTMIMIMAGRMFGHLSWTPSPSTACARADEASAAVASGAVKYDEAASFSSVTREGPKGPGPPHSIDASTLDRRQIFGTRETEREFRRTNEGIIYKRCKTAGM